MADSRSRTRTVWREPGMPGLLLTTGLAFAGFAVLMPVAPMHVIALGGNPFLAGLANAVLMATTILTQLVVERVRSRIGWSAILVLGCLLLGVPALVEIFAGKAWHVILLAAVRGTGFGIITVCGASAVAVLFAPERRGRAVGAYGLAVAAGQLVLTPASPWIAETAGFTTTFVLAAIPIVGVPFAISAGATIERRARDASSVATGPPSMIDRRRAFTRVLPAIVALTAVTCSGGAIMTFAPQFVAEAVLTLVALLVFTAAAAFSRWLAGGWADRHGAKTFIVPALCIAVLGLVAIAGGMAGSAGNVSQVLLVAGALLVGTSFGTMQNVTLVRAFELAGEQAKGTASTAWNVAFDAGTGIGAMAIGALATRTSFAFSFVLLAAMCLVVGVALLATARPTRQ
ncbi:MAG: MFS transporter [Herbaspirillum sp.]